MVGGPTSPASSLADFAAAGTVAEEHGECGIAVVIEGAKGWELRIGSTAERGVSHWWMRS